MKTLTKHPFFWHFFTSEKISRLNFMTNGILAIFESLFEVLKRGSFFKLVLTPKEVRGFFLRLLLNAFRLPAASWFHA